MIKKIIPLWLASVSALPVWADTPASQQLNTLTQQAWQYEQTLQETVPADISPDALKTQHQQFEQFLSQVNNIDPDGLNKEEKITRLMQAYRLQNYVDEYRFEAYKVPITSEYGFHSALASLPTSSRLKNRKDYQVYLDKLSRISGYIDQQIAYMRQGIKEGYTQPKAVLSGYEKTVSSLIAPQARESLFYRPFITPSATLSQADVSTLSASAKTLINEQVNPALERLYTFFVEQYIPQARTSIAAKDWPNGEAYYQNRIAHYTTTSMNARQIHELGLQEVRRIRQAMKEVVKEADFDGSVDEFITFLRTDPQFYATTAKGLLKEASYIAKKADAGLPALFETLPRIPYGVAPVPDNIAPKYTTGRYIHPANPTEPAYYWVNTYALDKRPLYALPALTLHEAVPGHHLQISLADEMDQLPNVRRATYISAFGEGWGLYSEFLGIEMGIYETPYDNFGRLSYEMWRACRLVVDTGMHMFGWSRQQAIDYMLKNTALSEHNITTEVDRYISWPAQALSYKIGEIKIRQLRDKAEQELGERFDIRQFHSAVLRHGSVPLFVLEDNINQYIQAVKTGQ